MDILTPEKIEELLDNRLKTTVALYNELDTSETEIYNIIYFRLYFDFSTAIEGVIANILYVKYGEDEFILNKSKINSPAVSKYIPNDEMKLLIGDFGDYITINDLKSRFENINDIMKESFYQNLGITKKLYDIEKFNSFYTSSRETRNKLAHGLTTVNVDYNNKMLFKFIASYYTLIEYYKSITT